MNTVLNTKCVASFHGKLKNHVSHIKKEKVFFSKRELEIIELMCKDKIYKEIAEELFLSIRTIEGHSLRIQQKMNVRTVTGVVVCAIKMGIFKISE